LTLPSTTMQPATLPALLTRKTWRISALPMVFSTIVGASRPSIAAFTSSTTL
jgi:hypothetical protein